MNILPGTMIETGKLTDGDSRRIFDNIFACGGLMLSRLVIINILKQSLQLDSIVKLLSYINGLLDDRSDDIITDSELYHLFVSLLIELNGSTDANALDDAAEHITVGYVEPSPGARRRLCKVMIIMAQSYFSSELKKKAELLMCELD